MKTEERAELARLVKWYGVRGVLEGLRQVAEAAATEYPPDAIIHEHVAILAQAEQQCFGQIATRVTAARASHEPE
jgi:hypothetical protein